MPFRPESPADENVQERTAVLWCNLGSPDEPTASAVRPYLADFLGDPRVVEIPRALWALILHGVILRTRPAKSAAKYASIWTPEGSPLKVWTKKQATLLAGWLGEKGHLVTVRDAMRYGQPSIASRLDALKAEGVTRVLVLQAYPQYSATTTASVIDAVNAWSARVRRVPEFRFVNDYHDDPLYIDALAQSVQRHWQHNGRGDQLVMSFHGIPERNIRLGDPYQVQCLATARLLAERLALTTAQYRVTGTNNQVVTVNAPNVTLTNQNDGVSTLLMTVDGPGTVNLGNSGASGLLFDLGGQITVASSTPDGTYFGTFNVTVNY